MTSAIDPTKPLDGQPASKAELRDNLATAKREIEHGGYFVQSGAGAVGRQTQDKLRDFCISVKDFGATADGSTDDTAAIRAAYAALPDSGGVVLFPPGGTYVVSDDGATRRGVALPANSTTIGYGATILRAPAQPQSGRCFWTEPDAANISIKGLTFNGNRRAQSASGWGQGQLFELAILGSRDVLVEDVTCRDSWTDGFYVDSGKNVGRGQFRAKNVIARRVIVENCRRQGITVPDCDNLSFIECQFLNANGTEPEYGVDLEPDVAGEMVENVYFDRCIFENNRKGIGLNAKEHRIRNILVTNCLFSDQYGESGDIGIVRTDESSESDFSYENIRIVGNIFTSNNGGIKIHGTLHYATIINGISVDDNVFKHSSHIRVMNCSSKLQSVSIRGNRFCSTNHTPIFLDKADGVTISDNIFEGDGINDQKAIKINSGASRVIIRNNEISGFDASRFDTGIFSRGRKVWIGGNQISSCSKAVDIRSEASDVWIDGNHIVNCSIGIQTSSDAFSIKIGDNWEQNDSS